MRTFSQILLEMSFDAKKAKERIDGLMDPINEHLFKLCLMPTSSHRDHWIYELKGWFITIARLNIKPKNKKLSKDTYFQILFEEPFEGMSDYDKNLWIDPIKRKYPNENIQVEMKDIDVFIEKIRMFHNEICEMISMSKFRGDNVPELIKKHLKV